MLSGKLRGDHQLPAGLSPFSIVSEYALRRMWFSGQRKGLQLDNCGLSVLTAAAGVGGNKLEEVK